MQRCWNWLGERRVTSGDWLQGGLLIWFAIALSRVTPRQRAHVPIVRQMTALAPFEVWIIVPCVLVLAMIVCIAMRWPRRLGWCLVGVTLWWTVWTILFWRQSSTYLTPAFPLIVAIAAGWRSAELRSPP